MKINLQRETSSHVELYIVKVLILIFILSMDSIIYFNKDVIFVIWINPFWENFVMS